MRARQRRRPPVSRTRAGLSTRRLVAGALLAALAAVLLSAAPAAARAPWWSVMSGARPSHLPAAGKGQIVVTVSNVGTAPVNGSTSPVEISDLLPAGVKQEKIAAVAGYGDKDGSPTCTLGGPGTPAKCTFEHTLPPYDLIEVQIDVEVEGASSGELNAVHVSGGGAPAKAIARPITVSSAPTPFGIQEYSIVPEQEGGEIDTQAGSHPFQLTTQVELNQSSAFFNFDSGVEEVQLPALPKDLAFRLPAGLIGNPTAFAQCKLAAFLQRACPPETVLGVASSTIDEPRAIGVQTITVPVFNLEPAIGEPARFGFLPTKETPVFLDAAVRTGEDYGVTVNVSNIVQTAEFLSSEVTFWGVPGDPVHDEARGLGCLEEARGVEPEHREPCVLLAERAPAPFLAMPTSCALPFSSGVTGDSWEAPADVRALASYTLPLSLDGCNRLPFAPQVRVTPDGTAASSPTGLNVDVHVPQDGVLVADGLAESAVKDISVTLPEGIALNPAGGDGLEACTEGQVGYLPAASAPPGELRFTPGLPEPFCPDASKVGTVKITTPLLPNPLEGAVYLASQNANPFGSLIGMYIVARDPVSGTLVKLPGRVSLNPSTGQVTGTFDNSPELAFEDAELHFFGGERAPLATPAHCGSDTTSATFAPWSGNEAVSSTSTFEITSGPDHRACPGATLPFGPSLTAGMVNNNGGSFSTLTTTIGREDGQQDMQSVQLHMPAGLSGILAGVALCPEPQADEGTCGAGSLIGETTVGAGVGNDPVSVKGGRVYLTEGYGGAPFGLSIVNPVKAGPLDLERDTANPAQNPPCDCVVVRAKIEVDPHTAALTVTTDPSGPHAIPHMIDGVPVQIKKVNVLVNRPGFTFNPTSCNPMSLTGSIAGYEGAFAPVSVPFQATNCALLGFKPDFKVSVTGNASKANGAALAVKLAYPGGSLGSEANIGRVKVELPKQLPSRLATLQHACLAETFDANPAACPPQSVVGHAKVLTPLLPVPLEGPAYFVSHGSEAFPDLTIVLHGYGVTVDLVGTTFISKAGITSTTFKAPPDVPFNSFELTLPQGPFSALTANTNLCGQTRVLRRRVALRRHHRTIRVLRTVRQHVPLKLSMPTEFTAQNGVLLKRSTPIAITGCAAPRGSAKHAKHRGKSRKRGG